MLLLRYVSPLLSYFFSSDLVVLYGSMFNNPIFFFLFFNNHNIGTMSTSTKTSDKEKNTSECHWIEAEDASRAANPAPPLWYEGGFESGRTATFVDSEQFRQIYTRDL